MLCLSVFEVMITRHVSVQWCLLSQCEWVWMDESQCCEYYKNNNVMFCPALTFWHLIPASPQWPSMSSHTLFSSGNWYVNDLVCVPSDWSLWACLSVWLTAEFWNVFLMQDEFRRGGACLLLISPVRWLHLILFAPSMRIRLWECLGSGKDYDDIGTLMRSINSLSWFIHAHTGYYSVGFYCDAVSDICCALQFSFRSLHHWFCFSLLLVILVQF